MCFVRVLSAALYNVNLSIRRTKHTGGRSAPPNSSTLFPNTSDDVQHLSNRESKHRNAHKSHVYRIQVSISVCLPALTPVQTRFLLFNLISRSALFPLLCFSRFLCRITIVLRWRSFTCSLPVLYFKIKQNKVFYFNCPLKHYRYFKSNQ